MSDLAARRFALLGDPVSHSKSPRMHAAAYAALGLPHTYEAIRVTVDELPARLDQLRSGEYAGFNVTVPHKGRVVDLADVVDPSARVISAANTLVRGSTGEILALNTDVMALAAEVRALSGGVFPPGAVCLVLGSGGAARAAVAAASSLGCARVVVRARAFADPHRALAFVGSLAGLGVPILTQPIDVTGGAGDDDSMIACILQATTAGMTGADPGDAVCDAVAWARVASTAIAIDLVYAPPETPFLLAARARGLRAQNGLGMLARQGALAFERWLGVAPPLAVMMAAIQ